jgi:hypothetical protein
MTLLAFSVAWQTVASVAMKITHVSFGWKSPLAVPILALGAALCGGYAALSTLRWMRQWRDARPLVLRDFSFGFS